jgi:hypothetical protein
MSLAPKRQMARLEQLAAPHIKRLQFAAQERDRKIAELALDDASQHAGFLRLIILYGDPHIGEPLSEALQRCCASDAEELRKCELGPVVERFNPFLESCGPKIVADLFYFHILPTLPGTDCTDKLSAIFAAAPPWLLWFTFADLTAAILELRPPDISSIEYCERSRRDFERWPLLPTGPFAIKRLSDEKIAQLLRKQKQAKGDIEKYPEEFHRIPTNILHRKYKRIFREYSEKNDIQ